MGRRAAEKKYTTGEEVLSKWPGSKKFYPAKIQKISGKHYEMKFEDGSVHKVELADIKDKVEDVKPVNQSKPRTRSRSKSPSNTKVKPKRAGTSRSRSRERVSTVSTPAKTAAEASVLRRSPRVRMARLDLNYSSLLEPSDDESEASVKVLNHRKASAAAVKIPSRHEDDGEYVPKETKRSPKSKAATSGQTPAEFVVLQAAKVAGLMTPGKIDVTDGAKKEKSKTKSKPVGRHFGGAIGAFCCIFILPFVVFFINIIISSKDFSLRLPDIPRSLGAYYDPTAVAIYLGWIAFQWLLYTLPLGPLVKGQPLRDGTCLRYRLNGIYAFMLSLVALGVVIHYYNPVNVVCSKLTQMMVTSFVVSYLLSVVLYVKARWCPVYALATSGKTGNIFYDFFMGRELNPSFLTFDLKMFLDLRPSLIGWAALNICFLYKDFSDDGSVSPNLALSAAFQIFYCIDALYHEEALISTMDITTEGLGFMLMFGNLSWVPFIFSIQSRYLLVKQLHWNWYCLLPVACMSVAGFLIFRLSNSQKDKFRKNPHSSAVAHLTTINTGLPKKILAGGWWGWLRHPNYTGDILMALSWCLPCGFDYVIPYTYFVYLLVLLCHRAYRDEEVCQYKYGTSWDTYRLLVRSRIFPHIF